MRVWMLYDSSVVDMMLAVESFILLFISLML